MINMMTMTLVVLTMVTTVTMMFLFCVHLRAATTKKMKMEKLRVLRLVISDCREVSRFRC